MFEKEKLTHKNFGKGEIVNFDPKCNYIDVLFYNGVKKKLDVKSVIQNGLITFDSAYMLNDIQEELKRTNKFLNQTDKTISPKRIKLLEILHSYSFEGFLHTTEMENFRHIVETGKLVPRGTLRDQGVCFKDVANQDVIDNTNSIVINSCRFYYYFKTPTNYLANYKHPVIMVFDENLIYNNNCFYTPCNAAKNQNFLTYDLNEVLEFKWDGIFERGDYKKSAFCTKNEDGYVTNRNIISGMRNAEFLIHGDVNVSCLKKVYFKDQYDLESAKRFCSKNLCKIFCLDRSKFC